MPAKIPATVVTGFLGAGKTTLIRHMLENSRGKRIALIINEFGDLGVDGDILKGCGDEPAPKTMLWSCLTDAFAALWPMISFRRWKSCWGVKTRQITL